MFLFPFRRRVSSRRGQALIEFAILLPVLALLLVMAIDFGRVFFGWVALHNAARIGADHAAAWDDAWVGTPDPFEQLYRDQYEELVLNDLRAINCDADPDGDGDSVPDPEFRNPDGSTTGDVHEDGDHAVVTLECEFGLLTPLAEAVLGGPVDLRAESVFAIHRGQTLGLPDAPPAPDPPDPPTGTCAAPNASFSTVPAPSQGGRVNGSSPLSVTFTDTSTTDAGCEIETRVWDFGDGPPAIDATTAITSNTFVHPGGGGPQNFTVTLTVTNSGGSDSATIVVRVTS